MGTTSKRLGIKADRSSIDEHAKTKQGPEPEYYSYQKICDMISDDLPEKCYIHCPNNRFRKGKVILVLDKFKWYHMFRILKVLKAEKKLRNKISNRNIEITWETMPEFKRNH